MTKSKTTWKTGQSGNPKGRPKGIQDRRVSLRKLLDPHAEKLIKKLISLALEGDMAALRLCLERIIPPIKSKDDPVEVSGLKGDSSLVEQGQAVINSLAVGSISPEQASKLMQAIAQQARIIEIDELEKRIAALEEHHVG